MQKDVVLLVIGAVFGFVSAVVVEIIKSILEKSRIKKEREINSFLAREKDVIDFLSTESEKKSPPAWLKLVATQSPIIVMRKMTGIPRFVRAKPDSASTSSLNSLQTVELNKSEHMRFIESVRSKRAINKFILGRTQIIGRHKDCEIRISDPSVSRLHALIRCESGNFFVYDLGSTSGTFVNRTRVDEMGIILVNRDVIVVGNSAFVFEMLAKVVEASKSERKSKPKSPKNDDSVRQKNDHMEKK